MLYVCYCKDKPNSLEVRLANRDAHLTYVAGFADKLRIAGPMTLEDGETMAGSLLIFDMDSQAEVEAFSAGDPYAKAGLFESVDIRPFKQSLGTPL